MCRLTVLVVQELVGEGTGADSGEKGGGVARGVRFGNNKWRSTFSRMGQQNDALPGNLLHSTRLQEGAPKVACLNRGTANGSTQQLTSPSLPVATQL